MNWFTDTKNNCHKATFLIEKKQHERLSRLQRIELFIHLTGCSICRLYKAQSLAINLLAKDLMKDKAVKNLKLDQRFKDDLQNQINNRMRK